MDLNTNDAHYGEENGRGISTKTEIYFIRNDRRQISRQAGSVSWFTLLPFSCRARLPSSLSSRSPSHITDMHHIKAVPIQYFNRLTDLGAGFNSRGTVELSYSECA